MKLIRHTPHSHLPVSPAFSRSLPQAKYYMVNIYRGGLYVLAVLAGEMPPLFVLEFLHRIFDVFGEYFGEVRQQSPAQEHVGRNAPYHPLSHQRRVNPYRAPPQTRLSPFALLPPSPTQVSTRALTDNFSSAYQLLEEMLDNGHPMITEPNALQVRVVSARR